MKEVINLGYLILTINTILYLKGFFKNGKAFKIIAVYNAVIFLIQLYTDILYRQSINNLYLSHFYFILQFIILSFFYLEIIKIPIQRQIIKISIPLCLSVLAIQYYINPNLYYKFNYFEIFITSFLLIIYSMFHFYNILNESKKFFYINMGILIYLFSSTIIFISGNLMISLSSNFNNVIWLINGVLYLIYQIFILVEYIKHYSINNNKNNE